MTDAERILSERGGAVPRYTSYPTAPHFAPLIDTKLPDGLANAARHTRNGVSVYLHIPFCDRLCWFCGCNTKHTLKYAPIAAYAKVLREEIAQMGARIGRKVRAEHVHFGGGSPSILNADDMAGLRLSLDEVFDFDAGSEISVEIDPSDVTEETLKGMRALGVTRVSVGVQDFDPLVQEAINRPQTYEQTRDVILASREAGVASVNADALYGLPLQTMTRLQRTIDQVLSLEPDRIALFGYAHVPWIKKHQKMIREDHLPGTVERFEQARTAAAAITDAGYEAIGIDHFAKPGDSLAEAARSGRLRRNFQGYTADQCEVLIPLGGSSIGQFPGGYIQNEPATARYNELVGKGALAAVRGYALTRDDVIRAHMIGRLMCDFSINMNDLVARFGLDATAYVEELQSLAATDADGLCSFERDRFMVTDVGRPFTRIVASRLDAYLQGSQVRYSKAV